ncbi:MAG: GNAT family N-acetyltransferase [Acidobacteria bacterium]|nr:GNAT family N-acetyltransferase [Acidobacteriota bacterium]
MVHITSGNSDLETVRTFFRAYGDFVSSRGIDISLAGIDKDIAALPFPYAPPDGALLLARTDEGLALGCVALKKRTLPNGEQACELKRLYVTPESRGTGAGRVLMQAAIDWAREHQMTSVLLDTQREKFPEATHFYESAGFQRIERFNDNPVPGIDFFRLGLV